MIYRRTLTDTGRRTACRQAGTVPPLLNHKHRQTDRQTGRQTDRQTGSQVGTQTDASAYRHEGNAPTTSSGLPVLDFIYSQALGGQPLALSTAWTRPVPL